MAMALGRDIGLYHLDLQHLKTNTHMTQRAGQRDPDNGAGYLSSRSFWTSRDGSGLHPQLLPSSLWSASTTTMSSTFKKSFTWDYMKYKRVTLHLDNLKRDPLETQHPKFENSRLGFIESVHERKWQMRHPSCRLPPGWSSTLFPTYSPKGPENVKITTLYRCTGRLLLGPPHGKTTTVVSSK